MSISRTFMIMSNAHEAEVDEASASLFSTREREKDSLSSLLNTGKVAQSNLSNVLASRHISSVNIDAFVRERVPKGVPSRMHTQTCFNNKFNSQIYRAEFFKIIC